MRNPLKDLRWNFLQKQLKIIIIFPKCSILNLLPSSEYVISLTFRVTLYYVQRGTYSEPCLLLKIQTYSSMFSSCSNIFSHIVAYLELCVILAYSELRHIQNPGISRTQDIFRTVSKHILVYSVDSVTLVFLKPCDIHIFAIFKMSANLGLEAYSESCLFKQIQAYSDIFNNDNINFLFFTFFHTFQRNFKRQTCFLTTMMSISMLD